MKSKVSTYLANSLLLISVFLFIFLVAEVITRVVMPNFVMFRMMHQPDDKLGYRLVPKFEMIHKTSDYNVYVKINSAGLRDKEFPSYKDPDIYRILALGDSFTFGIGVNSEETYPKILETLLNQTPISSKLRKYEVMNAGVDGYGTEQEYTYLMELVTRYHPDLVIIGLYSNDIADVMQGIPSSNIRTKIKTNLYFLSYLRGMQILLEKRYNEKIFEKSMHIYEDDYSADFVKSINRTKEYLVKIRDLSRVNTAKTLILIIPSCLEISRLEWEKKGLLHFYDDVFFKKNMSKFSDLFTEFGKTEKIDTLPLLPVFRNSTIGPLYFTKDMHLTKEGHRLAAETIYTYLRKGNMNF